MGALFECVELLPFLARAGFPEAFAGGEDVVVWVGDWVGGGLEDCEGDEEAG